MQVTIKEIIKTARISCKKFAKTQRAFFNFDERSNYLGWENWLTIDITLRLLCLSSKGVVPFHRYDNGKGTRLDIYVKNNSIAVEIKTTYIDDSEAAPYEEKKHKKLTHRFFKDAEKIKGLCRKHQKLLLLAVCFESRKAAEHYKKRVELDIKDRFGAFKHFQWYDCSEAKNNGHNHLLALSTARLPPS